MSRYDIAVVGSGLSGMLTALMLSREGKKVCLLEKEHYPGGAIRSFSRNGKTYSTGLHYFGGLEKGGSLWKYWKYFGIADTGLFEKMDGEAFDMISLSGRDFPLASGKEKFLSSLLPFFPDSENLIRSYLKELDDITGKIPFYNSDPDPVTADLSARSAKAWDFFMKFRDVSGLLPEVLSGNNFIYGAGRDDLSLYAAAIINHSFISGTSRLRKGATSNDLISIIVDNIKNSGGEIHTDCEVTSISAGKNFLIQTASGESFEAENLVSTLHPSVTISLINGIHVRKVYTERIKSLKNTPGAFTIFVDLRKKSFHHLPYNVHYFSKPGIWFNESEEKPSHYMLYTTAGDDGYAETAVIMMRSDIAAYEKWQNTLTGRRGNDYQDFKNRIAENLLDLVSNKFLSFRQHILNFAVSTPLTWRDYTGTPGGSMFGILKSCRDFPLTAVHPKTVLPGLYLSGQSTGIHGVQGVTTGAVNTCCEILGQDYVLNRIRNV